MKYIRTKNNKIYKVYADRVAIVECEDSENKRAVICVDKKDILKEADTIEELCDEFVIHHHNGTPTTTKWSFEKIIINYYHKRCLNSIQKLYGAIWTDKGLIYVAKMNDKGELELL